ncbi:hypothetical protein [Nonomuraea longispora]|nr:hypothetical protein [Nonomuraea longispora]
MTGWSTPLVVTLWHRTLSVTHRTADGSLTMPNPIHAVPGRLV